MKRNNVFCIAIISFMMIAVGCESEANAELITAVKTETPEVTVTVTTTPEPTQTPTLFPTSFSMDFLWEWEEIGPYLGKFLHPPVDFYDASEYLEKRRTEEEEFYLYLFDTQVENLARTDWPLDYRITGEVCKYFRAAGTAILDDLLCDKIVESKSKRYIEDGPFYRAWQENPTVNIDSIIFLTVEEDYNCFFWKDGGVNVIKEDGTLLFFDDEDIPLNKFTSEEVSLIQEGYILIDRTGETPVGKCNYFDFMEEITLE